MVMSVLNACSLLFTDCVTYLAPQFCFFLFMTVEQPNDMPAGGFESQLAVSPNQVISLSADRFPASERQGTIYIWCRRRVDVEQIL
jgi:hypothetical protein